MRTAFWLGWLIGAVFEGAGVHNEMQQHQQIAGQYLIGALCLFCALFTKQSGLRR